MPNGRPDAVFIFRVKLFSKLSSCDVENLEYNMIMADIYHVLARGVDKRKIFLDDRDRFRFIHNLFEFNDEAPPDTSSYYFSRPGVIANKQIGPERKPRKLLVNIYAFCLMDNHYHMMLSPVIEGGLFRFMKKLNMGYVKYFNERYKRSGTLFESRYKRILVKNHAHFIHLPYYIHFNPLDFKFFEWRERKLKNYNEATKFLNSYRWSSHLDYTDIKNFPSVLSKKFLNDFFGGPKNYKRDLNRWLEDLNVEKIHDIILE